ncbi:exosortase [Sphingomonas gellani]|uniref:Exosortase n=1 Tax=Sphingomonas gellani TaxID=1166340 RepID=A0A1H8HXG7_9SPHN|nr:exosortase [Sphingomonas gellani]SEN61100.1 exosortase [Sphingomonas gellani]
MRNHWFILGAVILFAFPGLYGLATGEWSTDQGTAGPIILVSGLWLLLREMRAAPPVVTGQGFAIAVLLLVPLLIGYLFAVAVGMGWLGWLCTYLALVVVLGSYVGVSGLTRLWFPLTYLLFLVPPRYPFVGTITQSRKLWLATTSVDLLSALGYDVAHDGTALYIDQYEMLIADACAGLNSLLSLLAIGLFYVYVLYRADWRYATLLAVVTFPVAMVANLARILLILLTAHYANAQLALGVVHDMAGLMMFLVALGCLIGVDALLTPLRTWLGRR